MPEATTITLPKIPWAQTAAILAVLGAIFSAWLFMDNHFAKDAALRVVQQEAQVTKWTFEESQNTLRMDILEDRIWREQGKASPDNIQILRWNNQIVSLEKRQVTIQTNKEQITIHKITQQ